VVHIEMVCFRGRVQVCTFTARYMRNLIAGLKAQMPGIRIEEWDYGHQKRQPKRSNGESALATYMGNMAPGERKHRREIQDTLGIPIATMNRL